MRKAERKNRDEFRKLLEQHVADGSLIAKAHWHDYQLKVRNHLNFVVGLVCVVSSKLEYVVVLIDACACGHVFLCF